MDSQEAEEEKIAIKALYIQKQMEVETVLPSNNERLSYVISITTRVEEPSIFISAASKSLGNNANIEEGISGGISQESNDQTGLQLVWIKEIFPDGLQK